MDLKKAIKERGWTLDKLAAKMNCAQSSLSSIVNGNPTLAKLTAVADAMGITLSELLSSDDAITITCPHCGKPIKYTRVHQGAKEEEKQGAVE